MEVLGSDFTYFRGLGMQNLLTITLPLQVHEQCLLWGQKYVNRTCWAIRGSKASEPTSVDKRLHLLTSTS